MFETFLVSLHVAFHCVNFLFGMLIVLCGNLACSKLLDCEPLINLLVICAQISCIIYSLELVCFTQAYKSTILEVLILLALSTFAWVI